MLGGKNIVIHGGLSESQSYVRKEHFDRILSERDALQSLLNSVEEDNYGIRKLLSMLAADPGGSIRHYINSIDRVLEKNS